MKIFLNDRSVQFLANAPENVHSNDLVAEDLSAGGLRETWETFIRYEKYQRMVVVDPTVNSALQDDGSAFQAFCSFFRVVQAAGGLVKNENGEFLFIHRFGMWDLPKGKIDKKDAEGQEGSPDHSFVAQKAAIREVKEETGLRQVMIIKELKSTWHTYLQKDQWYLKETRWFEMIASSEQVLKPQASEGIFLVKWTPPKELHCILGKTYASIRELLVDTLF